MWGESDDQWLGKILQQLNAGKSLGAILLETSSWTQRAKLLSNLKKVKKSFADFQAEVGT